MNQVCIVGRLTHTPELKATQSGKSVCSFSVAVERRFKDSEGNPIVDFIDCVAWSKQAEFIGKWFDKGVRVGLTGELQTRLYEKDGQKHKVVEVLVSTVEFADGKREANASATTPAATANNTNDFAGNTSDDWVPVDDDSELPF